MSGPDRADLSVFENLNQEKRVPWDKRSKLINEQFPSVKALDWEKALKTDVDLFGRILRDILKIDLAETGRPGPRSSLDYDKGVARLRQYMGDDFSILPFKEAFKMISGGRSVRSLASKTGLNRNTIHRLLSGEYDPDAYTMGAIATAFNKNPSYFLEYRVLYITKSIIDRFEYSPESTIGIYRKMVKGEKDGSN